MATVMHRLTEQQRVNQARFRGYRGGVIPMHRALAHFWLSRWNLLIAIALFVAFSALWLRCLPDICGLWQYIFGMALHYLPLDARLESVNRQFGLIKLALPCLRMPPLLPDAQTWQINCIVTGGLFLITFLLPRTLIPIVYLSRAILLIHATACVYFGIWPSQFPHTPDAYLEGFILSGIATITLVPLLFALTYYIFDFGAWRKAFLTLLTMAYLVLFIPFQVLFQAMFLQKSILYMPLLYIIFGMPADVLLIVGFYSWGMTWHFRGWNR